MSDKPLNVSARVREVALTFVANHPTLTQRQGNDLKEALATFERDLLEEVKGRVRGLYEALQQIDMLATNHGGWFEQDQFGEYAKLGNIAGSALKAYDAALSTLTPESPSNAAEAQAGFAKEKNDGE